MTRTLVLTITCAAPPGFWAEPFNFDDLSPEHQELFRRGKIPCQEGSLLDSYCDRCPFGDVEADEER
jgi:hypothetical protein